jgi:hypothetical protein
MRVKIRFLINSSLTILASIAMCNFSVYASTWFECASACENSTVFVRIGEQNIYIYDAAVTLHRDSTICAEYPKFHVDESDKISGINVHSHQLHDCTKNSLYFRVTSIRLSELGERMTLKYNRRDSVSNDIKIYRCDEVSAP